MPRAPAPLLTALLAVLVCVPTVPASLCDLPYCDCSRTYHPQLLNLNCSLEPHQTIELTEGSVPVETVEVEIHGGREVRLDQHAFSKLLDMQRLAITGANVVLVRKHAFLNLTVANLLLEITDADSVHFQSRAFAHIKGPVTANIARCAYMVIEAEVFSWLLQLTISSVPRLELSAGAFVMDSAVQTPSRHGPSMKIHFIEVMIPELSSKTFGASAAEIRMERIEVRAVKSDAFLANIFTSVLAVNSSFHSVEDGAFAQKAHIVNLHFKNCHIHNVETNALLSAITNLTIESCRVNEILSGAINITVVNLAFSDNEFEKYHSKGVYLQSWTRLLIRGNSFNDMDANAIIAPVVPQSSDFSFVDNEMIFLHKDSLKFIGDIMEGSRVSPLNVKYENNYYAQVCHCNVGKWLGQILGRPQAPEDSAAKSFCTVDVFFARCFNVPEGNMLIHQFTEDVCSAKSIQCEPTKVKTEGVTTEIKNTRFPHRNLKNQESGFLSSRDKKIIGLIFLIALCGMLLIIIITGIAWIKRKGYCGNIKNAAISSNTSCMSFFDRLFGFNLGLDNARSISRLSVNEYTERHRLNEPRTLEMDERTPTEYLEEMVPMEDKATQTLPEELTKELLESLREKLDDPDNYTEAREMIEHLYELIKVEESCNNYPTSHSNERFMDDENVYDVIQVPSSPNVGVGKNKKTTVSIGTKAPSLERLAPFSPYNRQTALCHEYFEPKDFAVHLYAELTSDREANAPSRLSSMPDVIAEQPAPRGPFLRAMREKMNGNNAKPKNGACLAPTAPVECFDVIPRPYPTSTQRSNKSTSSNASSKMVNRPLPEKPLKLDPGEGTSFQNR